MAAEPGKPDFQIYAVDGTRYAVVFRNDIPMPAGSVTVRQESPETGVVLRKGVEIGRGRWNAISAAPQAVRIDINPGSAKVVIQP